MLVSATTRGCTPLCREIPDLTGYFEVMNLTMNIIRESGSDPSSHTLIGLDPGGVKRVDSRRSISSNDDL